MKPQTENPNDGETPSVASTDLFVAFSAERRQHALAYLAQKPAAIPLGDLAEYLTLVEGDPSYDRYERVLTDLYHNHVPKLVDAGIVTYERETELVALSVTRRVLSPYLQLAELETVSSASND
ncbi:DUF7344 domain-containing protein [Natrarchaeobius halalkaliphilus]|nr:hypothetical protein [Natrarchaeobius halalkaliphilus]